MLASHFRGVPCDFRGGGVDFVAGGAFVVVREGGEVERQVAERVMSFVRRLSLSWQVELRLKVQGCVSFHASRGRWP